MPRSSQATLVDTSGRSKIGTVNWEKVIGYSVFEGAVILAVRCGPPEAAASATSENRLCYAWDFMRSDTFELA